MSGHAVNRPGGSGATGYLGLNGESITVIEWASLYDHIAETRLSTPLESDPTKRVVTEWTGLDPVRFENGCPWEVRIETAPRPGPDGITRHGSRVYLRARNRREATEAHWATVKRLETLIRHEQRATRVMVNTQMGGTGRG